MTDLDAEAARRAAARLATRGKVSTYSLMIGITVGALIVGVAVPFVAGHPPKTTTLSASTALTPLAPAGAANSAALPAAGSVTAASTDVAPVAGATAGAATAGAAPAGETATGTTAGAAPAGQPGAAAPSTVTAAGPAAVTTATKPGSKPAAGSKATTSTKTPSKTTATKTSGPAAASGPALTATDRGVTPTSILIGVYEPDLAGVNSLGYNVSVADFEGKYNAVKDEINEAGGINGRMVALDFKSTDALDENKMRQSCLSLANDDKVFAEMNVGGLYGAAVQCATEDTKTPLFGSPGTNEQYAQSGNYLISPLESETRDSANLAYELNQLGLLKGHKVGIADITDYNPSAREGFIATAKALGYPVASEYTFADDLETASSQNALAVAQFQRAGVDEVILALNGIGGSEFVNAAQNAGATWTYHASDDQGGVESIQNFPSSIYGSIGITGSFENADQGGIAATPTETACANNYLKRSYATPFPTANTRDSTDYEYSMIICDQMHLFAAAARAAGPNLTRQTLVNAVQTLGPMTFAELNGGASYGANKSNGSDTFRLMIADSTCKCWKPYNNTAVMRDAY